MSESYIPGQTLQRGDLEIKFQDSNGFPTNVYSISYAIYYVDPNTQAEILIGNPARVPVNPQVGEYYAALMVPPSATIGEYRIRWSFIEAAGGASQMVVMAFNVVEKGTQVVQYSDARWALIRRLRILLRDWNPDKHYHFVPPEHEGRIGSFNRVFGHIWEDLELNEYLEAALDWWNMLPPRTRELCSIEQLLQTEPAWMYSLIWRAIVHAVFALTLNWVHDEFSIKSNTCVEIVLPDGTAMSISVGELYKIQQEVREPLEEGPA